MYASRLSPTVITYDTRLHAARITVLRKDESRRPGAVRLTGSDVPYEGRLEVYYNGLWGTVCDDDFDDVDATVACYSLGFGSAMYINHSW